MKSSLSLVDILKVNGISPDEVVLIRHAISDKNAGKCYNSGFIKEYTQIQGDNRPLLKRSKYWMVFISSGQTKARFYCMYTLKGYSHISNHTVPEGFPCPEMYEENSNLYELEETDLLEDLKGRLIIDWGGSTTAWYQSSKHKKPVVAIQDREIKKFPGYEKLIIDHSELNDIVNDLTDEYREYRTALSAVYGVYLILYKDSEDSGKLYIGSASGEEGILGRWKEYANPPYTGGNKKLIELLEFDKEAYKSFQFSILQIIPKTQNPNEVIDTETLFKMKLGSRVDGLNAN